jgi:hypothetical protein
MYLNASDVAAACGLNKYNSPKKIAQRYIDRKTRKVEDVMLQDYIIPTKDVGLMVSCRGDDEMSRRFDVIQDNYNLGKIDDYTKKIEEASITSSIIKKVFEKSVSVSDVYESKIEKDLLMKDLPCSVGAISTDYVNKERGIREESKILDSFESRNKTIVKKRNDRMYYITLLGIKIGGRIDGYDDNSTKLIEVKNRQNRFFRKIPLYEQVQCEIYLRMLNLDKCIHIERFNGEDIETEYMKDNNLFDKIKFGLKEYKKVYNSL